MSNNKLQANGFVKTPESWEELTKIISGSPEAIVAAHMGWNLACKYHNEIMAGERVGCWEPPTHWHQRNELRHEKNKYEGISQKLTDWLKEMRDAGREYHKEDPFCFILWADLAAEIDELMDWEKEKEESEGDK